jgi:hypothetical protein
MDRGRAPTLLALGPNIFGKTVGGARGLPAPMQESVQSILEETGAPTAAPAETLDVAAAGPPGPLRQTLELLPDLDDVVLVQYNDRAPQHLYPKLDDRGYAYETVERSGATVTVIWRQQ